jgi:hypothetical protein
LEVIEGFEIRLAFFTGLPMASNFWVTQKTDPYRHVSIYRGVTFWRKVNFGPEERG